MVDTGVCCTVYIHVQCHVHVYKIVIRYWRHMYMLCIIVMDIHVRIMCHTMLSVDTVLPLCVCRALVLTKLCHRRHVYIYTCTFLYVLLVSHLLQDPFCLSYSVSVLMVQVSAGDFNSHCSLGCRLLASSTQLQYQ